MSKNKKELLIEFLKKGIKDNKILARILETSPQSIAVMKYKLVKEGILKEEEVYVRKNKKRNKTKEKKDLPFLWFYLVKK